MNDKIVQIFTPTCFGIPDVIWLAVCVIGMILVLRVPIANLRIVFKGRDRQLTIETGMEAKEKKDNPKLSDSQPDVRRPPRRTSG